MVDACWYFCFPILWAALCPASPVRTPLTQLWHSDPLCRWTLREAAEWLRELTVNLGNHEALLLLLTSFQILLSKKDIIFFISSPSRYCCSHMGRPSAYMIVLSYVTVDTLAGTLTQVTEGSNALTDLPSASKGLIHLRTQSMILMPVRTWRYRVTLKVKGDPEGKGVPRVWS